VIQAFDHNPLDKHSALLVMLAAVPSPTVSAAGGAVTLLASATAEIALAVVAGFVHTVEALVEVDAAIYLLGLTDTTDDTCVAGETPIAGRADG